jgi:hypothetical protein
MEQAPKRREFWWISASDLKKNNLPMPLFKRVAKIPNITKIFEEIKKIKVE